MKKILEVHELKDGYVVFNFENDGKKDLGQSFHWNEELALADYLFEYLHMKDKLAPVARTLWAKDQLLP